MAIQQYPGDFASLSSFIFANILTSYMGVISWQYSGAAYKNLKKFSRKVEVMWFQYKWKRTKIKFSTHRKTGIRLKVVQKWEGLTTSQLTGPGLTRERLSVTPLSLPALLKSDRKSHLGEKLLQSPQVVCPPLPLFLKSPLFLPPPPHWFVPTLSFPGASSSVTCFCKWNFEKIIHFFKVYQIEAANK